ncbi:hypothetical protein ACFVAJ_16570 [Agromyces sp. NPDC057679]|uniref:hypothetical protein n=1 Tax=Agromyces sp. NPDC057679 TaxID=3346207 RepID=UPI00366A95D2
MASKRALTFSRASQATLAWAASLALVLNLMLWAAAGAQGDVLLRRFGSGLIYTPDSWYSVAYVHSCAWAASLTLAWAIARWRSRVVLATISGLICFPIVLWIMERAAFIYVGISWLPAMVMLAVVAVNACPRTPVDRA